MTVLLADCRVPKWSRLGGRKLGSLLRMSDDGSLVVSRISAAHITRRGIFARQVGSLRCIGPDMSKPAITSTLVISWAASRQDRS